jgi:hypothetical protein
MRAGAFPCIAKFAYHSCPLNSFTHLNIYLAKVA